MPERTKWRMNEPAYAFLVALDISGFSNDVDPDQLLNHRRNFFYAVESTPLFPEAKEQESVKVHFLGDELRLAFLAGVGVHEVRDFINNIFDNLDRINQGVPSSQRTRIKGVVLEGVVTWRSWHGCVFLNGDLPIQAQRWTSDLNPDDVAVNARFRQSLQHVGIPVSNLREKDFSSEIGYMLRG